MYKNQFLSEPEELKKPYQSPSLVIYGEVSQISAAGSTGDPEGDTDGTLIDEPQTYFG